MSERTGTEQTGAPEQDWREGLVMAAEEIASALHHHNIGRDTRGWTEVSEAFALLKEVLHETRPVTLAEVLEP